MEAAVVADGKGQPFSVRFGRRTDAFMDAEAKRLKRSKSSLVEELADEAAKTRRFPGLAFRGDWPYRDPWIIGTGLDVWELCEILEHYDGSIDAVVADYDGVDERACRLALAYQREHPEEIADAVAQNNRTPEEWLTLYPFIEPAGRQ
ncbi:MAG: hypothetical protein U0R50_10140 [Gaiellales bacterium]